MVPILSESVSATLPCAIPAGGDLYLAWSISPASGSDCAKSMAFGIDNVTITPTLSESIENVQPSAVRIQKFIRNGQLLIQRGEETYDVLGNTL